jgi:hypothetical protein
MIFMADRLFEIFKAIFVPSNTDELLELKTTGRLELPVAIGY